MDPEVIAADNDIAFLTLTLLVEVEDEDFFGAVFVVVATGDTRVCVIDELSQLGENG